MCHRINQATVSFWKTTRPLDNTATGIELYPKKKTTEIKILLQHPNFDFVYEGERQSWTVSSLLGLIRNWNRKCLGSQPYPLTVSSFKVRLKKWWYTWWLIFVHIEYHDVKYIFDIIISILENHWIVLKVLCQSYDNAANMSEVYLEIQARLKEINNVAT